ncbi:MAG: 5-formyltetrahydrofolate cyclo-ligase [Brevinematales bacterium]|nr:5-formyltetrahydrofolate cyclo-ligase [Brevinematales bacterium]
MNKKDLRRELISKRNSLSIHNQIKLSIEISKKLISLEEWIISKCVMIYLSINSEVMTLHIMTKIIESNKILILPKVYENNLITIEVNRNFKIKSGYKGILEPIEGKPFEGYIDLAIIPLVGFNQNCFRIGYGGGFYDRFLATNYHRIKYKVGLAYECQKAENITKENHDVPLSAIITEKNIYRCY